MKSQSKIFIPKQIKLFLIIGALILISTVHYYNSNNDSYNNLTTDYYKLVYSDSRTNKFGVKHILLWNSFFESKNWDLFPENSTSIGEEFFLSNSCEVTNCVITSKRDYLENETDFDAVVFHTYNKWSVINPVPTVRSPHQYFVMSLCESPDYSQHKFHKDVGFFNWTMTYKLDSDIFSPYGYILDIETKHIVAPAMSPNWRPFEDDFNDPELLELTKKKTKSIAWFVSHCSTYSRREFLVKDISKHIHVDIYGACGRLKCTNKTKCDEMLDTDYKFYLSFENSLCPDYVTEKLFDNLKRKIIPIVYGGVDYTKFAPPKSYINVDDFNTVDELVNYLKFLDENPKEYIKYFWWNKYYNVEEGFPKKSFCNLCKKLNQQYLPKQTKRRIHEWWTGCFRESSLNFLLK